MMNNDMLNNIEYLREKANVSYEEAQQLLEQNDGNVMRVLVELEHQGRVYSQPDANYENTGSQQQYHAKQHDGMKNAKAFFGRAMDTRLVVEKKNPDGGKKMLANVPVPFAVLFAICAPWLTAGTVVLGLCTGVTVRIDKADVEEAVA